MPLSGSKSGIGSATSEALALAACALLLVAATVLTPLDSTVRAMLAPLAPKLFSPTLPLWTFTNTTGFLTLGLLALMSGRTYRKYAVRAETWRENGVFLMLGLMGPAIGGALGLALGLSELATGSQRLSQILWSGLVILGLAHALYSYVLPLRNDPGASARLPGLPARASIGWRM